MIAKLKKYVEELELDVKEIKEKVYDDIVDDYYDRVSYCLGDFVDSTPIKDINVDLICFHKKPKYDYVFVLLFDYQEYGIIARDRLTEQFNKILNQYYYGDDDVQVYNVCNRYLGFGFDLLDYDDFDIWDALDCLNDAIVEYFEEVKEKKTKLF